MAYPCRTYAKRLLIRYSRLLIPVLCVFCCIGGDCLLVTTSVGDDAVLPCEVDPTIHPTFDPDLAVYWTRLDLPLNQYVHFLRDGKDIVDHKCSSYEGRTSLFMDEVKKGNVSLKLSRVNSSDEGNYTCYLPEFQEYLATDQLIVVQGRDVTTSKAPVDGQDEHVEETTGQFPWWGGLIIIIVIIIIISISGLIHKKRQTLLDFCTHSIGGYHRPTNGIA